MQFLRIPNGNNPQFLRSTSRDSTHDKTPEALCRYSAGQIGPHNPVQPTLKLWWLCRGLSTAEWWCLSTFILGWMSVSDGKNSPVSDVGPGGHILFVVLVLHAKIQVRMSVCLVRRVRRTDRHSHTMSGAWMSKLSIAGLPWPGRLPKLIIEAPQTIKFLEILILFKKIKTKIPK